MICVMKRFALTLVVLGLLFLIPFGLWQDVRLFALNAESGRVVWSRSLPNDKAWTSYPQIAKAGERDIVLVWAGAEERERLFAFDTVNGKRLWTHSSGGWLPDMHIFTTPLPVAGTVGTYTDMGSSELMALELNTGQELWRVPLSQDNNYSNDGPAYALSNQTLDKIIVVRQKDSLDVIEGYSLAGKMLWSVSTQASPERFYEGVFGDETALYIAPGPIFKLEPTTGKVLFTSKEDAGGGFSFDGETLYAAWAQGLAALDTTTGETLWTFNEPDMRGLFQSPTTGENIYVTYSVTATKDETTDTYYPDSWLFAFSKKGQEVWRKVISYNNDDLSSAAFGQVPALLPGGVAIIGENALFTFNNDGTERWQFPLKAQCKSAGSGNELVYITAGARRYQHWLAYLNPQWH
jgi:outer membrane protein assembly factor BamB